jgi:low affinity Fe/Cu permease
VILLSRIINRGVAAWGSPVGVAITVLLCVVGHIYFTMSGAITTQQGHYLVGISEIAIIGAAMILHASAVETKAIQIKLDALILAASEIDDSIAGIEGLPEKELDEVRSLHMGE